MKSKQTTLRRSQKGFTLVELLVVIGILAALAAVVVPNVAKFAGRGDTTANTTEAQTVQSAMDLYLADNNTEFVTANPIETDDFAASDPILYPAYMRMNPTKCSYTWAADGIVTQGTCS